MLYLYPNEWETTRLLIHGAETHTHDSWEVCIFTQGSTLHNINGEDFLCSAGDVFVLGPPHTHTLTPTTSQHGHWDIYFSKADFKKICRAYPNLYETATENLLHFRLSQLELNAIIAELANISLFPLQIPDMCNNSKMILGSILHYLFGIYTTQQLQRSNEPFPDWFYALLVDLQQPQTFCQSVNQIVNNIGYSHSQFSSLFKKYAGLPLIDFLMNKRMEYAAELLRQTTKSTLTICMEVGYESYSFFLKSFKLKYGLTPLQYRKQRSLNLQSD